MSQSADAQSDDPATPALGARENFWGDTDNDDNHVPAGERRHGDRNRDWGIRHSFTSGVSKFEYVAHAILKESGASFLCPVCLFSDGHDEPSTVSELSDPEVYVPKQFPEQFAPQESNQYQHRRRYCFEEGHVSFGGKLADRPRAEFLEVVDAVLDWAVECNGVGLRESEASTLRDKAEYWKMDKNTDDTEVVETLLRKIASGEC